MDKTWKNLTINLVKSTELKLELIQTDTAGRGLVATQDLSKNDVLFTETPFVVGPTQSVGPHFCANCSQALNVGVLQGKQTQVMTLHRYPEQFYYPRSSVSKTVYTNEYLSICTIEIP